MNLSTHVSPSAARPNPLVSDAQDQDDGVYQYVKKAVDRKPVVEKHKTWTYMDTQCLLFWVFSHSCAHMMGLYVVLCPLMTILWQGHDNDYAQQKHTMTIVILALYVTLGLNLWMFCVLIKRDPGYLFDVSSVEADTVETTEHCLTCDVPKPLRSKHCRVCQRCVALMDHHCAFINNCIGARNHRLFLVYVTSQVVHLMLGLVVIYHYLLCAPVPVLRRDDRYLAFSFNSSLSMMMMMMPDVNSLLLCRAPGAICLGVVLIIVTLPLLHLWSAQVYSISHNLLWNEAWHQSRYAHFQHGGNPFDRKSLWLNWNDFLRQNTRQYRLVQNPQPRNDQEL